LLDQDQWKQELLESIRPENIELVGENDQVKLYGVKFFTYNDGRNVEQEIENLP
jgi:type III restriction enzyme